MGKIHKLTYVYNEPEYEEKFRIITYPGIKPNKYLISNHGRVINIKNKKEMKIYLDDDDHEKITLVTNVKHPTKRGNRSKHYFIHRLMAWEFIGPPPDEEHDIVNHLNGIPCCNLIHNLEWTTVLGNTNHAKEHGLMKESGINSSNRKYSEKDIRKICKLFEDGYNNKEIYEMLFGKKEKGTKYTPMYNLINKLGKRIIFRDIVSEYHYVPDMSFFKCDEQTQKIREMIRDGKTNIDILKEFNYKLPSDNRTFYNKIISERVKCEVLFNDYRKYSLEEKSK